MWSRVEILMNGGTSARRTPSPTKPSRWRRPGSFTFTHCEMLVKDAG
jgi:hypothetical protein